MSTPEQTTEPSASPEPPITGTCHCGRISITIPTAPIILNECRCTVCYKYGALWCYFPRDSVTITENDGAVREKYVREDLGRVTRAKERGTEPEISFNRCSRCGVMTDWTGFGPERGGEQAKMGVNARIFGDAKGEGVLEGVEREVEYY